MVLILDRSHVDSSSLYSGKDLWKVSTVYMANASDRLTASFEDW